MKFSEICTHFSTLVQFGDFQSKFIVNFQHIFFEKKMLKYFTYKICEIQYFRVLTHEIQ
jgi:hypothetical protein